MKTIRLINDSVELCTVLKRLNNPIFMRKKIALNEYVKRKQNE